MWIEFSFQSQLLQFFGISSNKIDSKINVFSQLSSENCEIKSIISDLPRAFQQHQECPKIHMHFSVLILFISYWENGSIINSFHALAPNNHKSSQCTPTHWGLPNDYKSAAWRIPLWKISTWQTKQNKLPCFIDR